MNKLETKVEARNKVNALAIGKFERVRNALAPFAGQKIILATGGFSAKFAKAVSALELPNTHQAHVYISSGHGYALTMNCRVAVTNDSGTFYAEATVYLFDLKAGVLGLNENYVNPGYRLRTDFDVAQIRVAREVVKQKRSELQAAESALCYFGEHDNH